MTSVILRFKANRISPITKWSVIPVSEKSPSTIILTRTTTHSVVKPEQSSLITLPEIFLYLINMIDTQTKTCQSAGPCSLKGIKLLIDLFACDCFEVSESYPPSEYAVTVLSCASSIVMVDIFFILPHTFHPTVLHHILYLAVIRILYCAITFPLEFLAFSHTVPVFLAFA